MTPDSVAATNLPSDMTSLPVQLGERSYNIHVGRGLIARAGALIAPLLKQPRAFIVTDSNVAPLYLAALQKSLEAAGIRAEHTIVPAGEATKDFNHLAQVLDAMLAAKCERNTMIIALGGGVIGDLTGFAAAVLLRGVDFVQIPTTLLAQVDSSVGGKTGINTRTGKNLVGAFHQPRLVIADIDTLATLPRRELLAGYAEVAKYGVIDDPEFWDWLEANGAAAVSGSANTHGLLAYCVTTSCKAKARVVAADEREGGVRALLNLGHTFGHAQEAEMGYGAGLLHGESVAIGMVMAADISVRLGLCPAEDARRIRAHLQAVGLPVSPPKKGPRGAITPAALIAHMGQDKKVKDGTMTFVLMRGIGKSFLSRDVPLAQLQETLTAALAE